MRATTATAVIARRHPVTGTRRQGYSDHRTYSGRRAARYPV